MIIVYLITGLFFLWSILKDRQKTLQAIKIAWKKFINVLPSFIQMFIIVSVVLHFVSPDFIQTFLGSRNVWIGLFLGAFVGSITLMPGFIAYPMAAIFLEKGVSYVAISSFVTTLMMVGILTYPIEKKFFGIKVTIYRNIVGFGISVIIAFVIGIVYGEIF